MSGNSTKEMLSRIWESGRLELLRQLYWLLHGDTAKTLDTRARSSAAILVAEERARASTADGQTSAEERWRIHASSKTTAINDVDFGAWDFIRAAMLIRAAPSGSSRAGSLGHPRDHQPRFTCPTLHGTGLGCLPPHTLFFNGPPKEQAQEAENDLHDRDRPGLHIGKNGLWTAISWDLPPHVVSSCSTCSQPRAACTCCPLGLGGHGWEENSTPRRALAPPIIHRRPADRPIATPPLAAGRRMVVES